MKLKKKIIIIHKQEGWYRPVLLSPPSQKIGVGNVREKRKERNGTADWQTESVGILIFLSFWDSVCWSQFPFTILSVPHAVGVMMNEKQVLLSCLPPPQGTIVFPHLVHKLEYILVIEISNMENESIKYWGLQGQFSFIK